MIRKFYEYLVEKNEHISETNEYGSFYGTIINDLNGVENWFMMKAISPKEYLDEIELPLATLNGINVDEKDRGKGYGNKLYKMFEEKCLLHGIKTIILECDISEMQIKGFDLKKWYISKGFDDMNIENDYPIMIKYLP